MTSSVTRNLVLLFTFALSIPCSALAGTWSPPTGAPPGSNAPEPINVSAADQFKEGTFGAKTLNIFGTSQYLSFGNSVGGAVPGIRFSATTNQLEYSNGGSIWSAIGGISSQWTTTGSNIFYSAGNVGAGTSVPQAAIDAAGGTEAIYSRSTAAGPYTFLGNTGSYGRIGAFDPASGWQNLVLAEGGNVGIGTTSPGQKLTVAGVIESTSGGIKFPDGTTQTTAASGALPTCSVGDSLVINASGAWACSSTAFKSSCKAILGAGQSTGNGTYWIKTSSTNGPIQVYCNMTIDGGGWTLVESYTGSSTTPIASTGVSLNSGTYLESSNYTALNAGATNYLFTTSANNAYFKVAKTYAATANCQNMNTPLSNFYPGYGAWAWNDGGCNLAGSDYSGVSYADTNFGLYALNGAPGSYSTNGTSWTTLSSSYVYYPITSSVHYVGVYVR